MLSNKSYFFAAYLAYISYNKFMKIYKNRRDKVLKQMVSGVAVVPSAFMQVRSNDTEFPFRQESNFYYLSGFNEPEALLLLCKSDKESKSVLFLRKSNPEMEMWVGKFLGVEAACEVLGVDEAYDINELEIYLPKLLENHESLYLNTFSQHKYIESVKKVSNALFNSRTVHISPRTFLHLNTIIEKLRLIKETQEVNKIKKALSITQKAHHASMAMRCAGKKEYEVQALIEYIFKKEGSSHDAYESIVAGGDNANTLHYVKNSDLLKEGDLMLIDAGCEWDYYASDITRTSPVSGKFSEPQKALYNGILKAQLEIISLIKPGITKSLLQNRSEELLTQVMVDLGILSGSVEKLVEEKTFKKYYPHGIGHWMGLDVHDTCPYKNEDGSDLIFEAGMVLTIEPALYLPLDDKDIPQEFRGIGIRIEDNILVTQEGHENLSYEIAKTVDEIEAMCKRDYKDFL